MLVAFAIVSQGSQAGLMVVSVVFKYKEITSMWSLEIV
jgi:hypothetical protein